MNDAPFSYLHSTDPEFVGDEGDQNFNTIVTVFVPTEQYYNETILGNKNNYSIPIVKKEEASTNPLSPDTSVDSTESPLSVNTVSSDEGTVNNDGRVFSLRNNPNASIGININDSTQAFTDQILSGEKTIETRNTASLRMNDAPFSYLHSTDKLRFAYFSPIIQQEPDFHIGLRINILE